MDRIVDEPNGCGDGDGGDDDDDDDCHRSHIPKDDSDDHPLVLLDGGTGEELFRLGLVDDRKTWSAAALARSQYHPLVVQAHANFLKSGCHCITTNSYGVVPGAGFVDVSEVQELAGLAGKLARRAVNEQDEEDKKLMEKESSDRRKIAAETGSSLLSSFSLPAPVERQKSRRRRPQIPRRRVLGSLGPLVESYRPDLIMEHERGVQCYKVLVRALWPHVDMFLLETMGSVDEAFQGLDALARCSTESSPFQPSHSHLDCWVSFTLGSDGRLRDGTSVTESLTRLLDLPVVLRQARSARDDEEEEGKSPSTAIGAAPSKVAKDGSCTRPETTPRMRRVRVSAILFNCCEPEAITSALEEIHHRNSHEGRESSSLWSRRLRPYGTRLGAYANRLTPVPPGWTMEGSSEPQPFRADLDPVEYGDIVETWIRSFGVTIVGGCCGITPQHIQHLHDRFFSARAQV
jgi:S-methylmethionine-dependent homocysteine/selenocysteine methylase